MPPDLQSLWDYDDPAGSEQRFRDALADATDLDHHAEMLTQIARALGLQHRFDEAHAQLDEADATITDETPRARVRSFLERGRTYNSSGRRDDARALFTEAWERARDAGLDGLAVDAAHMLGIVEPAAEALAWNERALAIAESSDDPDARRWKGSLHNNIGWTHHGAGDYATALAHFEAALAHRREQGEASNVRVARWCVARCLRSLDRVDEALAVQRDLEQEIAGDENPDGYVHEELAECLHALGRADEARPYFARAHAILSADPWLVESDPQRLERLRNLAGVKLL
ncbi:MAG: tetratricopeptide repeat protein [bacterium]|nr:tetratricopeptide repeat protein [bacterium]